MELNEKVTQLEDEIKILKNEVQAVLLDLRESFLNAVNPFNPDAVVLSNRSVEVDPLPVSPVDEQPDIPEKISVPELPPEEDPEPFDPDEAENTQFTTDEHIEPDQENGNGNPDMTLFTTDAGYKPDSGNNGTAPRYTNTAWHPETGMSGGNGAGGAAIGVSTSLELDTIDNLSRWVEESVARLGHERTRTILDITETMGYISPDLKKILVKFIHPVSDEETTTVTTQDYLSTLVQLNTLLKTDSRMEIALLFILILCQEYDNR